MNICVIYDTLTGDFPRSLIITAMQTGIDRRNLGYHCNECVKHVTHFLKKWDRAVNRLSTKGLSVPLAVPLGTVYWKNGQDRVRSG